MKNSVFSVLVVSLMLTSTQLLAQDVIVYNNTSCDYLIDVDDNSCSPSSSGPITVLAYDQGVTYPLSSYGFTAPRIESIAIYNSSSGGLDYIYFGDTCGNDNSPHPLDAGNTCAASTVVVEWSVLSNDDFEIIIN